MNSRRNNPNFSLLVNLILILILSLSYTNFPSVNAQDNTPPTITVLSPVSTTYSASDVDLNFTVNESTSWIGYSLDATNNITVTGNTTLLLSEGTHNLTIFATDYAEKPNSGKSKVIIFSVDTLPPFIDLHSPLNITYNTNNVSLALTVNEEASVLFNLDDDINTTFVNSTILYDLSYGKHTLTLFAEDLFGNNDRFEIKFFVDYQDPLTILTTDILTLVVVVEICYIVYILVRNKF